MLKRYFVFDLSKVDLEPCQDPANYRGLINYKMFRTVVCSNAAAVSRVGHYGNRGIIICDSVINMHELSFFKNIELVWL